MLREQGGFTRRVTDAQAKVRSELAAYKERTSIRKKIKGCVLPDDEDFLDAMKEKSRNVKEKIDRLEQRDRVASVPSCLKIFMACRATWSAPARPTSRWAPISGARCSRS